MPGCPVRCESEDAEGPYGCGSKRRPNPNRPTLSQKTILNMVAVLSAMHESATVDYELLATNPLRGILRRKNFPTDALRPRDTWETRR